MSHIYSAIGNNTPENREHLEKVGSKRGNHTYPSGDYLLFKDGFDYLSIPEGVLIDFPEIIGCRNNDPLFQAVTALRDDKIESEQLYVCDQEKGYYDDNGEYIILCKVGEFVKNPLSKFVSFVGHKATLSEIQERFK